MLTNYYLCGNIKIPKGIAMIKTLINKLKQIKCKRLMNKPQYPIHSLSTGRIVYFEDKKPASNGAFAFHYAFRHVKNFAILQNCNSLTHIVSGQELKEMWLLNNKDYCVHNLQDFAEHPKMKLYMRKHNLTENSLLSFAQIMALEQAMNKRNVYTFEEDKMFH